MTANWQKENERFDRWWRTQDWDGAYTDVAWDAWWEAVRDATDEEIIEVLLPDQKQKREISDLKATNAELARHNTELVREIQRLEGERKQP